MNVFIHFFQLQIEMGDNILVERRTLDLVDPVQMGSRGEFFFHFYTLTYDTFGPLVAKLCMKNALNYILVSK